MFSKTIRSIVYVFKLQWRTSKLYFFWLLITRVLFGLLPVINAYAFGKLVDVVSKIATGQIVEHSAFYFWLLVILIPNLVSLVVNVAGWRINSVFSRKISVVIVRDLILKLYELNQEQLDSQGFNVKIDRSQEAAHKITFLMGNFTELASSVIAVTASLMALVFVAPWIALMMAIAFIPDLFVRLKVNRETEKQNKQNAPTYRMVNRMRALLVNPRQMSEFRLVNAFKKSLEIWQKQVTQAHDSYIPLFKRHTLLLALAGLFKPLIEVLSIIFAFYKFILSKEPSLSQFIFVRGLIHNMRNSLFVCIRQWQDIDSVLLPLRSLDDVYNTQPIIVDGKRRVEQPISIELKNVDFKYPNSSKLALKDISFKFEFGQNLALVGANGSGKTTIVNLLMRQYLPTSGVIEVNGYNIKDLNMESYRSLISYLGQRFFIINHLSIRDNLLIDVDGDLPEEDIWQALRMAEVDTVVRSLDNGLDTRLDVSFDDGTALSFGQRQRICIARSFLRKAPLLFFDEPTSAIDTQVESKIFNNIYAKNSDHSVLAISHKFSAARKANKIIVLDAGKIVETGSHNQLIRNRGLYWKMFNIQAKDYR